MPSADVDLLWAAAWALTHLLGVIAMAVLTARSARQLLVAEHWRAHAVNAELEEAGRLVLLTRDRHRRNVALTVAAGLYLLIGLLVVSVMLSPWMGREAVAIVTRTLLTLGEVIWIGAAWQSVLVGDRLLDPPRRPDPQKLPP